MAKTYRDAPKRKIDDSAGLLILNSRARKTRKRLAAYVARLDPDFIYEACVEIGLEEAVSIDDASGQISFDITNLQMVSLTAALAALVEVRNSAGLD